MQAMAGPSPLRRLSRNNPLTLPAVRSGDEAWEQFGPFGHATLLRLGRDAPTQSAPRHVSRVRLGLVARANE